MPILPQMREECECVKKVGWSYSSYFADDSYVRLHPPHVHTTLTFIVVISIIPMIHRN